MENIDFDLSFLDHGYGITQFAQKIMLLLIAIIMIVSCIAKLKLLISIEYSKVKSYLDEMQENEK